MKAPNCKRWRFIREIAAAVVQEESLTNVLDLDRLRQILD